MQKFGVLLCHLTLKVFTDFLYPLFTVWIPSNNLYARIIIIIYRYCKLHVQRAGSYAVQSAVIAFVISTLLSTLSCHPVSGHFLLLPLLCSLLISILVVCTSYPHYIYSDRSTVLFLINVSYDVVQVTSGTLAVYSLAMAFNYWSKHLSRFPNNYSSAVSILSHVFLPDVYVSLLYIAAAAISCILTVHPDSIIIINYSCWFQILNYSFWFHILNPLL